MNNILITFVNAIDPTSGGVERVYHNLAPFFTRRGDNVYAIYKKKAEYDCNSVYTDTYCVENDNDAYSAYNQMIDKVVQERKINVIICPFPSHQLFNHLSRLNNVKVFFHVHNVPSTLMLSTPRFLPESLKNTVIGDCVRRIRQIIRFEKAFRRIERNGMKVVLLSEQFREDMKKVWQFNESTITAVPNPFCIDDSFDVKKEKKDKVILYVGRMSEKQKRVSSLLRIWQKVQNRIPDYRLDIVGGGPDQPMFEAMAKELGLQRVKFYGFQQPEKFYKQSVMSCMTSNYEGFSMVLVEAMQYGCVPFAFNSFASLVDIIDNGVNGVILSPFDEDEYADRIVGFVNMPEEQQMTYRRNAIAKSKTFSVENIGRRWLDMIDNYY